jgi:hypothetical protein
MPTESSLSAERDGRPRTLGAEKGSWEAEEPVASWIMGGVILVRSRGERQAGVLGHHELHRAGFCFNRNWTGESSFKAQ